MKTTITLYQSPRLSVEIFKQWLTRPAAVRSGGILPPVNPSLPSTSPSFLRTILCALAGMACAVGAAFAIGMSLGPIIGFIPAFLPSAAASSAIVWFFYRLASI